MKLSFGYIYIINHTLDSPSFTSGLARALVLAVVVLGFQQSALGATGREGGQPPGLAPKSRPAEGAPIAPSGPSWHILAMRPERDIEAILLDTFNEAVRSGSAGALLKFISRNPDHPLADKARQLLERGNYPPARKTQSEWVDSKIVEFDAARRAGPDALKAFIARHPSHPLAAEARRLLSK